MPRPTTRPSARVPGPLAPAAAGRRSEAGIESQAMSGGGHASTGVPRSRPEGLGRGPDPVITDDADAIVRVDAITICGTDLHILKGDVPG